MQSCTKKILEMEILLWLELQQFSGSIVFRGNLKKDDLSKYVKVSDAFTAEIDKRPVFFKSWYLKGIQITHLRKDRDTFLSFHEFKERYNVQTNFLTFHSLISALKSLKANNRNSLLVGNADFESFLSKFLKSHKANKMCT